MAMAEQEGNHRRSMEEKSLNANIAGMQRSFAEARLGQVFAFGVSLAFLAVGAFVAIHGQPWVGGLLGSIGLGSIVANFIRGRQRPEEPTTPSVSQSPS
jgi:uncharacterized membrane protein